MAISPTLPIASKLPLSDICDKVKHLQVNVDCNFLDLQPYLDDWNPKADTVDFKVLYSEFKSLYSQISAFSTACVRDMSSNSAAVAGLSSIEIVTDYIHNGHVEFVRANCSTLERLIISSKSNYAMGCLFADKLIVYRQLKVLKLLLGSYTYVDVISHVPEQYTPCPNLRYLEVSRSILFDNSILLNSNMPYLEYLNVGCTKHVVRLAKKNSLFDLKLPSLRHMVLQLNYGADYEDVSMEELGQVAFGLAPNIHTLELTGTRSNSDFFAYIPADAQLSALRSVFVPAINMDLSDIVYLLKSAPAVEELTCNSMVIGSELETIEPAKWPDFVYTSCHPLGPHFSKLTVNKLTNVWRQARVFMLIAVMCPRFSSVFVSECKQGGFKSCLYSLSKVKQYAPFNRYSVDFSAHCHLYSDMTTVIQREEL
ncbi:hypothetical protein EV183_002386 [Coemansia sp. RSA 2336]|nr:hypothetical protein EV183_002386 [Coemansia sp. RSA 2336]